MSRLIALVLLAVNFVHASQIHMYTNRPEALDHDDMIQLHMSIRNRSEEISWDGTGIQLSELMLFDNEEDYMSYMYHGTNHTRDFSPRALSSSKFRRAPITCRRDTCDIPGSNNPYFKLSTGQQIFITQAFCAFFRKLAPGVFAYATARFTNVYCAKYVGGAGEYCQVSMAIFAYNAGEAIGAPIQSLCDDTIDYLHGQCPMEGGVTTCTVNQYGTTFNQEEFITSGTAPCENGDLGKATCTEMVCHSNCNVD